MCYLGKIQYDGIEGHFGHLRKLAGGNYWASVKQFMEGEASSEQKIWYLCLVVLQEKYQVSWKKLRSYEELTMIV